MSLAERLLQDMKMAMKDKDQERLSVIRMIRSSIKNLEIETRQELDDEQILCVIQRLLKQANDSLQEFEKAGREDLAQKARSEIAVLQSYLPAQLSDEELRQLVEETIAEVGATSRKEMGRVMKSIIPKVKGRADNRRVHDMVQQFLS